MLRRAGVIWLVGAATALTLLSPRRVPIYQVDAFANKPFEGNPAAVCPLKEWLSDSEMLDIAAENALSETAFFVARAEDGEYDLRWFTPTIEVDMCGHATLAAGAIVLGLLDSERAEAGFHTRSGRLAVRRSGEEATYTLDFPLWPCEPAEVVAPAALVRALGGEDGPVPVAAHNIAPLHGAPYYLFLYENEAALRALSPAFSAMEANVVATAPAGSGAYDFASRWFGPLSGIPEDPVTGSAHSTLGPYWAQKLSKSSMVARQVSQRGGTLKLEMRGERLLISGPTALFMEGTLLLPPASAGSAS